VAISGIPRTAAETQSNDGISFRDAVRDTPLMESHPTSAVTARMTLIVVSFVRLLIDKALYPRLFHISCRFTLHSLISA
jgi:hypothetical protein